MAIQWIASAVGDGTSTFSIPCQIGDVFLALAVNNADMEQIPSIPAGWTTVNTPPPEIEGLNRATAYRVAGSTTFTSGAFGADTTRVMISQYRNCHLTDPIGQFTNLNSNVPGESFNGITFGANTQAANDFWIPLVDTDGTPWIIGFYVIGNTNADQLTSMPEMTRRAIVHPAPRPGLEAGIWDTGGVVANSPWPKHMGNALTEIPIIWRTSVIELRANVTNATFTATENGDTLVSDVGLLIEGVLTATEQNETVVSDVSLFIEGVLSVTEQNDTLVSDVGLLIEASLTATEANETLTTDASLIIEGVLVATEANETLTSDVGLLIEAALTLTEANDTLTSDAQVDISADASMTEANDTLSTDINLFIEAVLNVTEANDTATTDASVIIFADLSETEDNDTLSSDSGFFNEADLNVIEANDTLVSDAQLDISADVLIVEADDTLSSDSGFFNEADLNATEANDTLVSDASLEISADLSIAEDSDTLVASVDITIVANLGVVESNETLISDVSLFITADLVATEGDDLSSSSSDLAITADLSVTEDNETLSASVDLAIQANFSIAEDNDTLMAAAAVNISASLNVAEANDTPDIVAGLDIQASLNAAEDYDTLVSSSDVNITVNTSIVEDDDTLSSVSSIPLVANAVMIEEDDALAAEASMPIIVNFSVMEEYDTLSSEVAITIQAESNLVEESDEIISVAALLIQADLDQTEDDDTLDSFGSAAIFGFLDITEDDDVATSTASTNVIVRIGADGCVNTYVPQDDSVCCLPSLCDIDPCNLICNFVNFLPSGPLWDGPKDKALSRFQEPSPICVDDVRQVVCPWDENLCASIVSHSVYTALRLHDLLLNALWPALRESSPYTAYDTMDDWLEKLGWVDCMQGPCRDPLLGGLTPLEIGTPCGSQVCEIEYPDCLVTSLKHGIIMSLARLQRGIIPNICSLNWVIEPLYSVVKPIRMGDDQTPEQRCPLPYSITPTTDEIPLWQRDNCLPGENLTCQAYFEPNSCYQTGLPDKIYPLSLAAECIVRSVLQGCGMIKIERVCDALERDYDCCANQEVI